ncbi:MAG: hypothetical protein M5U31_01850 [Acidimicrobiia bacterium]|nr:hypothetical protein [Acidimicrobiia bacterium]
MRRLWLLPALVLAFAAVPYAAQDSGNTDPEATVDEVPLTDDADGTVEPGWGVEVDTDTDMVGVRWDGDAEATFTVRSPRR